MTADKSWTRERTDSFVRTVAGAGATATIHQQGMQYVSDAEFWAWMQGEVVKRPGLIDSADDIRRWVTERPRGTEVLIQGRGMEWDWVRDCKNDPRHLLHSARLGTLADDRAGVDMSLLKSKEVVVAKAA